MIWEHLKYMSQWLSQGPEKHACVLATLAADHLDALLCPMLFVIITEV